MKMRMRWWKDRIPPAVTRPGAHTAHPRVLLFMLDEDWLGRMLKPAWRGSTHFAYRSRVEERMGARRRRESKWRGERKKKKHLTNEGKQKNRWRRTFPLPTARSPGEMRWEREGEKRRGIYINASSFIKCIKDVSHCSQMIKPPRILFPRISKSRSKLTSLLSINLVERTRTNAIWEICDQQHDLF